MKPTLEQCYNQSRSLLGDDEVSGGEIFTDTVLQPHTSQAIRELFRVLRGAQDPFVLTEGYFVLPANTSVFDPATAGITNIPEPEFVDWVLSPPATTISAVTLTTGDVPFATVTATGHGMGIGTSPTVVVYGVQGFDQFNNPNQSWSATVVDANTIKLNGCTATGTYTSDGFVVSVSAANQFNQMDAVDTIERVAPVPGDPMQTNEVYAWQGGVFRFIAAGAARLLRITYRMSGIVNTTSSVIVPFDDCQDYISTRAAGIAAATRGASARAAELNEAAIGPTDQADGSGGILGDAPHLHPQPPTHSIPLASLPRAPQQKFLSTFLGGIVPDKKCVHPKLTLSSVTGDSWWYVCDTCGQEFSANLQPYRAIVVRRGRPAGADAPANTKPGA